MKKTLSLGQNPFSGSPFLSNFTPNWHLHYAFTTGQLKHFSEVLVDWYGYSGSLVLSSTWHLSWQIRHCSLQTKTNTKCVLWQRNRTMPL